MSSPSEPPTTIRERDEPMDKLIASAARLAEVEAKLQRVRDTLEQYSDHNMSCLEANRLREALGEQP